MMKQEINPYIRQAQYYETDQMAVVHHSNYIRWFEEARIYYLEQIGLPYDKMEELGIMIPVLGAACEYKASVRFNEQVEIQTRIVEFNGIKMTILYRVIDHKTGKVRATGETKHCFVTKEFKPLSLKKSYKEIYETFAYRMEQECEV
ncbi:MAG: yneP [Herbinix sp.]|jgi:acyl-CoA thioester hydrolase|nr:yneP [Herbinix sp.]